MSTSTATDSSTQCVEAKRHSASLIGRWGSEAGMVPLVALTSTFTGKLDNWVLRSGRDCQGSVRSHLHKAGVAKSTAKFGRDLCRHGEQRGGVIDGLGLDEREIFLGSR